MKIENSGSLECRIELRFDTIRPVDIRQDPSDFRVDGSVITGGLKENLVQFNVGIDQIQDDQLHCRIGDQFQWTIKFVDSLPFITEWCRVVDGSLSYLRVDLKKTTRLPVKIQTVDLIHNGTTSAQLGYEAVVGSEPYRLFFPLENADEIALNVIFGEKKDIWIHKMISDIPLIHISSLISGPERVEYGKAHRLQVTPPEPNECRCELLPDSSSLILGKKSARLNKFHLEVHQVPLKPGMVRLPTVVILGEKEKVIVDQKIGDSIRPVMIM